MLGSYFVESHNIAMTLLGLLGKALLKKDKKEWDVFEDGMKAMRMTCYPPCPQSKLVMGLASHSNVLGITILNKVNGVHGLRIKKDGIWVPVKVSSNALVVNARDILAICHDPLISFYPGKRCLY